MQPRIYVWCLNQTPLVIYIIFQKSEGQLFDQVAKKMSKIEFNKQNKQHFRNPYNIVHTSDGTSPTLWTRGLATLGLAGTRGLASPIDTLSKGIQPYWFIYVFLT